MDILKLLKLNLQFFSTDDAGGGDTTPPTDNEQTPPVDETKPPTDDKTFTQAEMDKIITERVKRLEKDKQEAIDEAKKLAGMNESEKQKHELEKLLEENESLKLEKNRYSLGREATKMLNDAGITADDELLEFVVKADADATKQAVQSFSALVASKVDDAVKEKLKGTPPKVNNQQGTGVIRESINAMKDSVARIKAIQDNPHLFK